MTIVQTSSSEIEKVIEKRHEMILAHEKFGMKIKDIVVDYGISIGAYYYWQDRYSKEGILGLVNKKTGAERPHNKTSNDIEEKILQITSENIELDAKDIFEIVKKQYGFDKSVRTIERILQRNGINRGKMLGIVDVPTIVENPKGNGKKEKAHSQDRKFFYDKNQFQDIESVDKAIPEYLRFRNESKGQWARYGQTALSAMKDAEENH
jgi:transposase